jgi:inhibitor of cysteine peptidase
MRRLSLAALLLLAAAACGGGDEPSQSYSDPSQPIEVSAGSEFTLSLQSNQSTGYQWVLLDTAALGPLQLVSKDYSVPRENQDRDGAGGTERWVFRAPAVGSAIISLSYQRPGTADPPAGATSFQVTVR